MVQNAPAFWYLVYPLTFDQAGEYLHSKHVNMVNSEPTDNGKFWVIETIFYSAFTA